MEEKFCKDCPCLGPIGPLGTRDAKWCAYDRERKLILDPEW